MNIHHKPMRVISESTQVTINEVTGAEDWRAVDAMLRDYLPWVMHEVEAAYGVRFDAFDEEASRHHAAFSDEAKAMMSGKGCLLLARLGQAPAAVVALKPIDREIAEVKRLYVRPNARGRGIGRALMEGLVLKSRQSGYRALRLETLSFMKSAVAIYESLGFERVGAFDGSQAGTSGLAHIAQFMRLEL